jgi:hypothetical protein
VTHMNWSAAKQKQYLQLLQATCKGTRDRRHVLLVCSIRSPRTWFRKRRYWQCLVCNLRAEMVK